MSDDEKAQRKERARQRRIETGRELEGRGFVDHAVKEYLRAKAPEEAARLLASKGRTRDAGQAILDGLKVTAEEAGRLGAKGRALAEQAAAFFDLGRHPAGAEAIRAALAAAPPVSDADDADDDDSDARTKIRQGHADSDFGSGPDARTKIRQGPADSDFGSGPDARTKIRQGLSDSDFGSGPDARTKIRPSLSDPEFGSGPDARTKIRSGPSVPDFGSGPDARTKIGAMPATPKTGFSGPPGPRVTSRPPPGADDAEGPDPRTKIGAMPAAPSVGGSFRSPAGGPAPSGAGGSFRPPGGGGSFRPPGGGGSFRPPGGGGGSFRPPGGGGSFRPPAGAGESFRAPPRAGESASPRASEPVRTEGGGPPSFRPPREASSSRPPSSSAASPPVAGAPSSPVAGAPSSPAAAAGVDASTGGRAPIASSVSSPSASSPSVSSPSVSPPSRAVRAPIAPPVSSSPGSASTSKASSSPSPGSPRPSKLPAAKAERLGASGEVVTDYASERESGWRDASDESIDLSIQEHLAAGRKGTAARIARDAGRYEQALAWFLESDLHMQAGACLRALGRNAEALEQLLHEEPGGTGYRKACFEIVPIAAELGRLDFEVDRFLGKFLEEGPLDRDEVPTFLALANVYRDAKFPRGARRCVAKILAVDGGHEGALALRAQLDAPEARVAPRPSIVPMSIAAGLPSLPTLEEFVALCREHAPK